MKPFRYHIAILSLIVLITSCSSSDDNSSQQDPRTYQDVQNDFSSIEFVTGNNDITLEYADDYFWEFRVIMPDVDFTNNNRPLIISLHGCANCQSENPHLGTSCYVEEGYAALDAIIISPYSGDFLWYEVINQEKVLQLVDLASDFLPVDTSKIVIEGYSDGGIGAWYFGESRPETFSAAIPSASYYNTTTNGIARVMPIPMYVIHGENDTLFPLEDVEMWVQASVDAGSDITLEVATGLDHYEPCNYVQYMENAAAWLQNSVWN